MIEPTEYDFGPEPINIIMTRGDDFSMVLHIEGDRDADTFAASYKYAGVTAAFTVSVGSYNAGLNITPVTLTISDATTDTFAVDTYLWGCKWTSAGVEHTIAGGTMKVLDKVQA